MSISSLQALLRSAGPESCRGEVPKVSNCFHLLVHSANAMLKATAWGTKNVTFLKDANIPGWLSTCPTGLHPQYAWGTGREKKRQVELKNDSSKLLLQTLEQPLWFLSWSLPKHSFLASEYKCSNIPAAIEQIEHWSLTPCSKAYIAACWLLSNVVSIVKHMWCHGYGRSNVSRAFMWASSSVNSGSWDTA